MPTKQIICPKRKLDIQLSELESQHPQRDIPSIKAPKNIEKLNRLGRLQKKKWTRPTKATSTKPKNEKKLSNFYDQDRNEKLNTILLAYKSSRSDNEDIVDTWLKSLMSDLTPKKTTKSKPKPHYTRPVIIRR